MEDPNAGGRLCFSNDGNKLAVRGDHIMVLDIPKGQVAKKWIPGACRDATFSPAGDWLAFNDDNGIVLWSAETGGERRIEKAHVGGITDLHLSPDGEMLASCGNDREVKLWRMPDGAWKATLTGHLTPPECVVFSPDGCSLLTAEFETTTCKVWHLATRTELCELPHAEADNEAIADGFARQGDLAARTASLTCSLEAIASGPSFPPLIRCTDARRCSWAWT